VGRAGSPILDKYPPKDPALVVRGPPAAPARAARPSSPNPGSGATRSTPPASPGAGPAGTDPEKGLIGLERPFDLESFSQQLGETSLRVKVPREDLSEVLRRISEFMSFGIYVYAFEVRPSPSELLKEFTVELQRVDYSTDRRAWVPFEEKGRSESPFGPAGNR